MKLNFVRTYELRMAVPWESADIEVTGLDWQPALFRQRMAANVVDVGSTGCIALAKWDFSGNQPHFRAFLVDTVTRKIHQSALISGPPKDIYILSPTQVRVTLWENADGKDRTVDVDVTEPASPEFY